MADHNDPHIKDHFMAESDALPDSLDIPDSDDDIGLEQIIAAILGDKHALSAEDLNLFDSLLNAPDIDDAQRQEFLQAIWNVVVVTIDLEWEAASASDHANNCGSNREGESGSHIDAANMLKCTDKQLSLTHKKAAGSEAAPENLP